MHTRIKINIIIILVIILKSLPFSFFSNYSPEMVSLIIYIANLSKITSLGYCNILGLALIDSLLGLENTVLLIVQYSLYYLYIKKLREHYFTENLLIKWFEFFILNFPLLIIKYTLMEILIEQYSIPIAIIIKKSISTIMYFPVFYYCISFFIKSHNVNKFK